MPETDAFATLSSTSLLDACDLMSFDPISSMDPLKLLSQLTLTERLRWADTNRQVIRAEFCSFGSWSFGKTRSYMEVVLALAEKVAVTRNGASITDIEDAIVLKVWNDAKARMSPSQREELNSKAQEMAARYGRTAKSQAAGFAALGAAQLSGFGIYMAGSAILGAVNSALGLGLGFGAFTGLSSLISTAIGPLGWAALGIVTVAKMGAPNWKKVLPVVVLIASQRAIEQTDFASTIDSSPDKTVSETPQPINTKGVVWEEQPSTKQTIAPISLTDSKKVSTEASYKSPISRMDKIIFLQAPGNRPLIKFASDLGCHDFTALDLDTQAIIRELFEGKSAVGQSPLEDINRNAPHVLTPSGESAAASKKTSAIRRKQKELSTLLPNVNLTQRAVERLLEYERDSILYTSFLQQLRAMNDGLRSDKHHVPLTSPKIFQRDAGNGGRVYYRRVSASAIQVELFGDKASQNGDYRHLQAT